MPQMLDHYIKPVDDGADLSQAFENGRQQPESLNKSLLTKREDKTPAHNKPKIARKFHLFMLFVKQKY